MLCILVHGQLEDAQTARPRGVKAGFGDSGREVPSAGRACARAVLTSDSCFRTSPRAGWLLGGSWASGTLRSVSVEGQLHHGVAALGLGEGSGSWAALAGQQRATGERPSLLCLAVPPTRSPHLRASPALSEGWFLLLSLLPPWGCHIFYFGSHVTSESGTGPRCCGPQGLGDRRTNLLFPCSLQCPPGLRACPPLPAHPWQDTGQVGSPSFSRKPGDGAGISGLSKGTNLSSGEGAQKGDPPVGLL